MQFSDTRMAFLAQLKEIVDGISTILDTQPEDEEGEETKTEEKTKEKQEEKPAAPAAFDPAAYTMVRTKFEMQRSHHCKRFRPRILYCYYHCTTTVLLN